MAIDFETQIKEKTDNQLSEIYIDAKDYQPEFIKLVELELAERKIPLDSLSFIRDKKVKISDETMEIGKEGSPVLIVLGLLSALIGGIFGIAAGYYYLYSKHTSSKGIECYVYNESTRKYGKWMLVVGWTVLVLLILGQVHKLGN